MKKGFSGISLVISTYNWPEALGLCLESVFNQSLMPDEVLIADDGSDLRTYELLKNFESRFPVRLKHIWHQDEGFRKTVILNKAILQAERDYIIQIDGDVVLHRDFIYDHYSVAEENTFVRGTRAHIAKDFVREAIQSCKTDFQPLDKGIVNRFNAFRIPMLAPLFTKKTLCSKNVRGSNLAFWRSDFFSVNGYNNDLKGWGHEDEELAARMVNKGVWKKPLKMKAVQYHLYHKMASRSQENRHSNLLQHISLKKTFWCRNGLLQSQDVNKIDSTVGQLVLA